MFKKFYQCLYYYRLYAFLYVFICFFDLAVDFLKSHLFFYNEAILCLDYFDNLDYSYKN